MHVYRVLSGYRLPDPSFAWRPAVAADEEFLKALFEAEKRPFFTSLNMPSALVDCLVEQQWLAQRAGYARLYPGALNLILVRDHAPVGRFLLIADGDRLHLVDLMIATAARNQGIGSMVINAAKDVASDLGFRSVTLSVAATNVGARRLYHRLGFKVDPIQEEAAVTLMMTCLMAGAAGETAESDCGDTTSTDYDTARTAR